MKNLTLFLLMLAVLLGLKATVQAQTCQPPTGIAVTTPNGNTAVVNFTPVAGAASYTVRYWWVADTTAAGAQTVTVTAPPATISGLQYPAYRVTVTSNCTATTGATSSPVQFQFPWASCGAPTNVQATAGVTATGIGATVTYGAVSGATSYIIQALVAGSNVVAASGTSTTTTASLTGLQANTVYIVRVYAVCATGTSASFGSGSFGTGGTGTTCDSVRNLHVSSVTSSTAVVSFTGAAGAASYTVQYGLAGTTAATSVTTVSSSVTLTGLQASRAYWVRVQTNCTATSTSGQVGTTFQTQGAAAPCDAVTNVMVTATGDSTAIVSFTPGQNNTSFHITHYPLNDSTQTQTQNTSASSAIIAGLIPGQTYYIQVTSLCSTGAGTVYTPSSPITVAFRGTSGLATRAALGAGSIAAYPNPAHHAVSLSLPAVAGASKAQVTLLNAVGQQVRSSSVMLGSSTTRAELDLTDVAPGLYTVRVVAGGQAASQRLVVE